MLCHYNQNFFLFFTLLEQCVTSFERNDIDYRLELVVSCDKHLRISKHQIARLTAKRAILLSTLAKFYGGTRQYKITDNSCEAKRIAFQVC